MAKRINNPLYKYNYLITGLRKKIFDNEFGPAGKLPAERILSEMYEVSRVTVRTALKQLKAEDLIEQQQGRGTFTKLQYTPASYANDYNIARKELFNVKFIVRYTSDIIDADPYFGQIMLGFYRAESAKYKYSISNTNIGMNGTFDEYLENNPKTLDQCNGLVIACSLTDSELDYLEKNNINFVCFGQANSYRTLPSVDIDNFKGIYDATTHLLEKGFRKILFFYDYYNIPNREQRVSGFKHALHKYNIELNNNQLHKIDGKISEEAENKMQKLISQGVDFDAILVIGDWATLGVFNVLKQHNIKIPEEVGIVCYDAYNWTLEGIHPRPTAVNQPFAIMGEKALDILSSSKNEKDEVIAQAVIRPYLIQGQST